MDKKKILLVEDDKALCQIYRLNLEMSGFELEEAHDGKVGLACALTHHPDLIILDLMLPGINGLELLKVLKEKETTRNIPVFVLTNLSEEEMIEAKNLGAQEAFMKARLPVTELVSKVKEVVTPA